VADTAKAVPLLDELITGCRATMAKESPELAQKLNRGGIALIDLGRTFRVTAEDLLHRHRQSPYVGRTLRGAVVTTLVRGHTVFKNGQITAKPLGQLVRPID
jgi:hypothetical protein